MESVHVLCLGTSEAPRPLSKAQKTALLGCIEVNYMRERVLVLSPHADDAEFGCGGTVAQHVLNGAPVIWITFVDRGYAVPEGWDLNTLVQECKAAIKELQVGSYTILDFELECLEQEQKSIISVIYDAIHDFNPTIIYTPFSNCRHQDHAAVHTATVQAAWATEAMILGYRIPNDLARFSPNVFVPLCPLAIERKLNAIGTYESQLELRKWITLQLIEAQHTDYSAFIEGDYVEPFELIKMVIR